MRRSRTVRAQRNWCSNIAPKLYSGRKVSTTTSESTTSYPASADHPPQFVIVGQIVQQLPKAADGLGRRPRKRQGRAQPEVQPALQLHRAQHPSGKVGRNRHRLHARSKTASGLGPVQRASPVPTRGILHRRNDPPQVIALHANVAVIDDDVTVLRLRPSSAPGC